MREIELFLESERGNWKIETQAQIGRGANASAYRACIVAPSLKKALRSKKLPNDLVLRLLDDPDPREEDKAVAQFDHFAAAWEKLAWFTAQKRFMEPIFCERRGSPPNIAITGSAGTSLPRGQIKKGDAVFSLKEGKSVWDLSSRGNLPLFTLWETQLLDLIKEVCSNKLHYRDWHSKNVLLEQLPRGSWEINIIDPGALIEVERVIWESVPKHYRFDKYEIGVSIMGIQDLIWIAVEQNEHDFYKAIKKILTHRDRQLIMPKIIDKR